MPSATPITPSELAKITFVSESTQVGSIQTDFRRVISNTRLSPHAVWRMLEESRELSTATFVDAGDLATSHADGRDWVIGVVMNLDLAQMSLAQGRSRRHPFFDEALFGMRVRARASDAQLLLLATLPSVLTGLDVPYLELCQRRKVDGVVFVSFPPDEPGLVDLVQSELACVAIDTHVFGPRSTFVISDNVGGGSSAVHHLAALGRRRIAFVGGTGPERVSADRRLGYESALTDLGIVSNPDYVIYACWEHTQANTQTSRLLELPEPPDAIFCASDVMAIGAMAAIESAGLRVPDDVAVVGFDDSELARLVSPSLTSVRQNTAGLGTTAIETILQILEGNEDELPAPVLPVRLEVRESTGTGGIDGGRQQSELSSGLSATAVYAQLGETYSLAAEVSEPTRAIRAPYLAEERRLIALAMATTPDQSFRNAFLDDIYQGVRASAFERDTDLLTFSDRPAGRRAQECSLAELCRRHGATGMIVVSLPYDDPETLALAGSEMPCVAIDIDLLGDRSGFVMSDNIDGGAQAVRHLSERGCERIAFLGGYGVERVAIDRRFGYQSELARLGLEQPPEYVRLARWDHTLAYKETQSLLELPEPPDAVFCASDVMAIGALCAIADRGLRVPEDVAVIGFDDIEYARLLTPSLTTIRQNRIELATTAVDALLRMLDRPTEAPPVAVIPVELIVRESTAGSSPAPGQKPVV